MPQERKPFRTHLAVIPFQTIVLTNVPSAKTYTKLNTSSNTDDDALITILFCKQHVGTRQLHVFIGYRSSHQNYCWITIYLMYSSLFSLLNRLGSTQDYIEVCGWIGFGEVSSRFICSLWMAPPEIFPRQFRI